MSDDDDFTVEQRLACLNKALGGRVLRKAPPPAPPVVKLSKHEQFLADELYEISLLPKFEWTPEKRAQYEADVAAHAAKTEAARLARLNAPPTLNGTSRPPMASFDGDIPFDNRKGQPAPLGINFVPFIALTKWCYTYAPKHMLQPYASAFFDGDKIYARDWDLYYIASEYCGVITFVPEHQLQALFDDLNNQFPEAHVKIIDKDYEGGFVIDFSDFPQHLRPRWLGSCASRDHYRAWASKLSIMEPLKPLPESLPNRGLEAYKAKVDAANAINKAKKKAGKAQTFQNVVVKRQDMVRQGLRAQRYLGMLPKSEESLMPDISSLSIVGPIDVTKPVPYAFDMDAIFIAIDLEAYESPPRMITEVGLATLDTRDLKGVAPGEMGKNWHSAIRGRHIRVDEYKHLVNHQYVQGCPNAFEFGESEFVPKDKVGSVLASCFKHHFSQKDDTITGSATEDRNIILVGHDLGMDIQYCHQLGFSVLNRACIKESIDTVGMYRAYTKDPSARSLGTILYDCDLAGWNLHNAGNDAVYTIQAMIAICIKSANSRGESDKAEQVLAEKTAAYIEAAKEKAKEDSAGWIAEDDGGVALQPTESDFARGGGGGGRGGKGGGSGRGGGLYTIHGAVLDV